MNFKTVEHQGKDLLSPFPMNLLTYALRKSCKMSTEVTCGGIGEGASQLSDLLPAMACRPYKVSGLCLSTWALLSKTSYRGRGLQESQAQTCISSSHRSQSTVQTPVCLQQGHALQVPEMHPPVQGNPCRGEMESRASEYMGSNASPHISRRSSEFQAPPGPG